MRVKCLSQEHSILMTWPGLEPGPLDLESGVISDNENLAHMSTVKSLLM